MKKLKHFIYGIFVLFNFMLTGCSRVYEVMFDNLLLASISNELRTPEYIYNCRIEIKTSDKFDIVEYSKICRNVEWGLYYEDYTYTYSWEGISGLFTVPNGEGKLTLYSYDTKILELNYKNSDITNCIVYKNDDVICEFNGTLKSNSFEQLVYYFLQGKLTWYNSTDLYKEKEVLTEGYVPNCEEYDEITRYYYPTGIISKMKVKHYKKDTEDENALYYEDSVDKVFFNPDGSEKTIVDRLFEDQENLVLPAGYSSRNYGDLYVVLIPKEKDKLKGYGATVSTNDDLSISCYVNYTFEYKIEDNAIFCEKFILSNGTEANTQKRRKLKIDTDYYDNVVVQGNFEFIGQEFFCNMRPSRNEVSISFFEMIKEFYIDKR